MYCTALYGSGTGWVNVQGYRTILSSPWYLNLGGFANNDWTKYYSVEPQAFEGSQEQHDLVIGGEVIPSVDSQITSDCLNALTMLQQLS